MPRQPTGGNQCLVLNRTLDRQIGINPQGSVIGRIVVGGMIADTRTGRTPSRENDRDNMGLNFGKVSER